nr:SdiA-regulated domain-containing protein [uncultured Desulfuromonas sp.]
MEKNTPNAQTILSLLSLAHPLLHCALAPLRPFIRFYRHSGSRGIAATAILLLGCQACLTLTDPPEQVTGPNLGLEHYQLVAPPIDLGPTIHNASGITYHPGSDRLFVVLNGPTVLLELDRSGQLQRRIELRGFEDTEGITWLQEDRFALVEERRRRIVFVTIQPQTTCINYAQCRHVEIDPQPAQNKGLEGITWDHRNQQFFVVKEKNPRRVYRVALPHAQNESLTIDTPWDAQRQALGLHDLSDLYLHQSTDNLLILSDESRSIVEVDALGRERSRLWLERGRAGLDHDIEQPEGLTFDAQGRLYVCSEPNRLYIFGKI